MPWRASLLNGTQLAHHPPRLRGRWRRHTATDGARGQCERSVPAFRDRSEHGPQVARALQGGGLERAGGSLAPAARQPVADGRGEEAEVLRIRAESNNAWGGRKIAWTMSQAGCGDGSGDEHDQRYPAPPRQARSRLAASRAARSLRARRTQRAVADGFQGSFPDGQRALPSAHRARRSLALFAGHRGLRQRAGRHGSRSPDHAVSPLRPAFCDADGQRPAVGRQRRRALHRLHDLADAPRHRRSATAVPIIPRRKARSSVSIAR